MANSPAPLPPLLIFLSATTGLVDAASVLGLGKVFTANMTGNVVFLGFAAADLPGFNAPIYLLAIATFMAGAVVAGRTGRRFVGKPLRQWLLISALVEASLLALGAIVAIGFDIAAQPPLRVAAIVSLTAIAMGFRNATVRQLKVPDLTTTVLTMTITGLAADSTLAGGGNINWKRRGASILGLLAGATVGAVLLKHVGLAAPLALAAALILSATLIAARHADTARPLAA